jgi:hypothetical protein
MKRILIIAMVAFVATIVFPETVYAQKDLKSIHSVTSDTVTNTATVYLTSPQVNFNKGANTTVQVNVTKISGTVGGTISLQGSIDGTNFKALNTPDTQTALATVTATDATNVYHWRLAGNPFTYYRVSWTGTGTMSASFTAKVLVH